MAAVPDKRHLFPGARASFRIGRMTLVPAPWGPGGDTGAGR